ncbi:MULTISPECIES: restriction endonuclease subunit S [Gardnerella]|uniref:Restriction endonuclease subunit S n=1 Tax=Gardnerella vaginalis TaxID=2702 RepID=A0AAW6Y428_GARVA|nr:restriction endonuclease subunit S [Gardnerella vaginalis]MDK7063855.1 restriction endonuclease subunit S [Gardnerella vaginalis]
MRKAYEEYKATGIQWLPKIPKHWEYKKINSLFLERKTKVSDKDYQPLSVTKSGILHQLTDAAKSSDSDNRKLVLAGDFVINSRSDRKGSCGVSALDGSVSLINIVLEPKRKLEQLFVHYLLRCQPFSEEYYRYGRGIVADLWTTRYSEMKSIFLPIPPREEQEQIVRFLDWKISSINKLINLKQQEITELKELKKATISDAVTHGLDKTVPMKDGGISWLGKIPQHWEILSLKHVSRINASIANEIAKLKDLDLVTFLPMENISETGNIDCSIKRPLKEVRSGFSSFSKSDVVIAKITPCFENGKGACLDELDTTIGFGTTELINLRANSRILPKFLYLITVLQEFRKLGERAMTGSAGQKRVPLTYIKNFTIGIPPIEEQKHILLEVDKRSKSIDKCILSKHEELKTLHDLKSSLIADVVTGKIDVRDVEIPDYEQVEETLYKSDDNDTLQSEDEIPEEV